MDGATDRAGKRRVGDDRADEARAWMVASQLRGRDVRDECVLAAMATVPREAFVDARDRARAYDDHPLPIGAGQTISQPYIVARMTELLGVQPGDRVLEVGTGSGYGAAVLAEMGCVVTSVERDAGLASEARERLARLGYGDRVTVQDGDGSLGWPVGAPWAGILVAAAAPTVPARLREQLLDGRRLVIPVGTRTEQELLVVTRHGSEFAERSDGRCVFVPLVGEAGWRALRSSTRRAEPPTGRPGRPRCRTSPAGVWTPHAPGYTRRAMTHVFVAPHPDDVALSCGGLIASLRELGQNVTVLTLFSGTGSADRLTPYQREALGFGSKAVWPDSEAFNRANLLADYPNDPAAAPWQATREGLDATQGDADAAAKRFWQRSSWYRRAHIHNESLAGQPVIDDLPSQGAVLTSERADAAAAGDTMAQRRLEDERFAAFAEVSVVWLDLPDAVFRGYEGDDQLLGAPRDDDPAPADVVRQEIARLEPSRVYLPLGIGGHVDHQLARDAGLALLADARRWVMPGPDYANRVVLYEDFPYAWWEDFGGLGDMPEGSLAALPADLSLTAEFADISDQIERKIRGIALYESQIERLFDTQKAMASAVRAYAARTGDIGRVPGSLAERYWVTTPA